MRYLVLVAVALQVIHNILCIRDFPANNTVTFLSNKFNEINFKNRTFYGNSFNNIIVRKKRGFVFFKGAVVMITQVLSKHIIATSPRGMIHSSEVDLLYDVPILIDGWKKPIEKLVKKAKPMKKKEKTDTSVDMLTNNIGVINASAIPYNQYYKMSYFRPDWSLNDNWRYQANRHNYYNTNRRKFYRRPLYSSDSIRFGIPNFHRKNDIKYQTQNKKVGRYESQELRRKHTLYNYGKRKNTESPSFNHYREYRERRGIYEHFEGFAKTWGMSLKNCILRAICEVKKDLLPEGESFINDVARILFTIPTNHDDKENEYVKMALEENVDCTRRFMVSCPHSPLQYFNNNFRISSTDQTQNMSQEDIIKILMYS